jgi:hypothetical protein
MRMHIILPGKGDFMCTYLCTRACTYMRVCSRQTHTCIHPHMHTRTHTSHKRTYMPPCIIIHISRALHLDKLQVELVALQFDHAQTCTQTYMHAYIHTYIPCLPHLDKFIVHHVTFCLDQNQLILHSVTLSHSLVTPVYAHVHMCVRIYTCVHMLSQQPRLAFCYGRRQPCDVHTC